MPALNFDNASGLMQFCQQLFVLLEDHCIVLRAQSGDVLAANALWHTLASSQQQPLLDHSSVDCPPGAVSLSLPGQPAKPFWQQCKVIQAPALAAYLLMLTPLQQSADNPPTSNQPASNQAAKTGKRTAGSVQASLSNLFHSHSDNMLHMFSIIERVAVTEFPVLVRGESGSGKELVAQAIHQFSQRKGKSFIAINCAALNANILESELFGHVKGAFTGAIRDHKGVFERAAGGTLFLDEIGEIPLELQAKLLRVLESGEFNRLGGEKPIKTDVRIITATHRALREEARLGRFRQDLLYRLRVIPIFVPPLRDRKMDIPQLATFILQQNTPAPFTAPEFSPAAMQALMDYDWPGNVRELKNTILYALTMSGQQAMIELQHLPVEISAGLPHLPAVKAEAPQANTAITADTLQQTLLKHQHNLHLAAAELGISRTTLWRYRKKFQV